MSIYSNLKPSSRLFIEEEVTLRYGQDDFNGYPLVDEISREQYEYYLYFIESREVEYFSVLSEDNGTPFRVLTEWWA